MTKLLPLLAVFAPFLSPAASSPALAFDIKRPEVRVFIDTMSQDHGFEKGKLEVLLKSAETKQPILDAISKPAERVTPWHEYRDRFLTEKRINQGTDFWLAHGEKLKQIPDPQLANVTVGILGVETSFGRITGRYKVLDALVTLGFDYPPRGEFFLGELREFLLLSREEKVDPATVLGSYAGAMGAAQFISSSYRKWAVDGDGDGHRDLWHSWDDVIGSVANYLVENGWVNGQPVVVPATLTDHDLTRFDIKLALNETVKSLREKGVSFETELPPETPAMLVVGQGKDGPLYRVGFNNFYVITRYNRSPMYAMAVHDLGEATQNFMRDTER
ncbi:MAG: lytic murein transglycosylase B [Steroidobacter sp.]